MSDFENLENYEASSEDEGMAPVDGRDIAFLLAGAAIGAGLALLFAPRKGSEVRRAIGRGCRRMVDELTERGHDLREELRERGQHLKEDLRGRAEDLREKAPNLLRFVRRERRRERRAHQG
jgi:hypothetical protein